MEAKKKILIVDDDDFVLKIIEMALAEENDYDVVWASNAKIALTEANNTNFDLIITDIIMPDIDGIQFINEIRKNDRHIPIIAMSGGDDGGQVDQYINLSHYFANDTLTKPFTKDELLQAIHMVLHRNDPNCLEVF